PGRSPLSSAPRFSSAFLPFFSATPCLFSSAFSVVRFLSLKSRKILFPAYRQFFVSLVEIFEGPIGRSKADNQEGFFRP
ncbi:MAG: hypothetical protein NTW40_06595, partial [Acidobacteria bacterium]|nr:hypothetical protein [Acidobacteriota bacterium]